MDLEQARDRRQASVPEPAAARRRETTRKRAEDARLRRAIREAFARQRPMRPAAADVEEAQPRLRVVADDAP